MKKAKYLLHFTGLLLALTLIFGLGGCGTTRAHFGIDHDVAYNWDAGRPVNGPHHKYKKPKPPKKKKPAPPKHKHKKPKHDKHHH